MSPISAAEIINNRIWSYNEPPKEYDAIKGYLAFYVGPWECYVDNEGAPAAGRLLRRLGHERHRGPREAASPVGHRLGRCLLKGTGREWGKGK